MSNVIPFPVRPSTEAGRRALREARKHRKRELIWLMAKTAETESEYTRTQAMAVLHAWREGRALTSTAERWLKIMCLSFDERNRDAARVIWREVEKG